VALCCSHTRYRHWKLKAYRSAPSMCSLHARVASTRLQCRQSATSTQRPRPPTGARLVAWRHISPAASRCAAAASSHARTRGPLSASPASAPRRLARGLRAVAQAAAADVSGPLLDVRTLPEFSTRHLRGAAHIPLAEVSTSPVHQSAAPPHEGTNAHCSALRSALTLTAQKTRFGVRSRQLGSKTGAGFHLKPAF
jgi:hypothetical protein